MCFDIENKTYICYLEKIDAIIEVYLNLSDNEMTISLTNKIYESKFDFSKKKILQYQ